MILHERAQEAFNTHRILYQSIDGRWRIRRQDGKSMHWCDIVVVGDVSFRGPRYPHRPGRYRTVLLRYLLGLRGSAQRRCRLDRFTHGGR